MVHTHPPINPKDGPVPHSPFGADFGPDHPTKCTQDPARIQPRHTSTLSSTCTHPADRDRSSRCLSLICTWDCYSDAGAPTHPRTVIIIHYNVFEEAPAQPSPPIDHHSSGLGCPEAAPKRPRSGPEAARGGLGPTENRSHGGSKLPLPTPGFLLPESTLN